MKISHRIVLGLGSNLGDSVVIIEQAIQEMSEFVRDIKRSSNYQTQPVGGPPQPNYLNVVVLGITNLMPEELLLKLQSIELLHGRVRTEHWGARTLDIDLIDFDSTAFHSETLTLPHPRAHERSFVLIPWSDVDPEAALVGFGSVKSILPTLESGGVVRL